MDLIDREALCEAIYKWIPKGTMVTNDDVINVLMAIEKAPTVDAVEVVRCKDCIREQHCEFAQYQGENGYCLYGERICDECLECFYHWRNNDTECDCQGLTKHCSEFRVRGD